MKEKKDVTVEGEKVIDVGTAEGEGEKVVDVGTEGGSDVSDGVGADDDDKKISLKEARILIEKEKKKAEDGVRKQIEEEYKNKMKEEQKNKEEALAEELDKAKKFAEEKELQSKRLEVAIEYSVPKDLSGFINGESDEDIKKQAETLAAYANKTSTPVPENNSTQKKSQGTKSGIDAAYEKFVNNKKGSM